MKKELTFACAAALLASAAWAQEEEELSDESTAAETAAEESAGEKAKVEKKEEQKWFFTLPLCRRVQGEGQVLRPGEKEWKAIEEGRFYPLGSSFRAGAEKSSVLMAFGKSCTVEIENGASFATHAQKIGERSRTIVLTGGEVAVTLPSNLPTGFFCVTTTGFSAYDMSGESKFSYTDKGDGYVSDVRCVTGTIAVRGRHYEIPKMSAADILRVRTTHDELETLLYGLSGDYIVKLDRGKGYVPETQEDGTVKNVVKSQTLDWHLSVKTHVQINRGVPRVGARMSVSMMTFDSAGTMKNHYAFAEGRPEVNTGELISRPAAEGADVAKRAAEVTTEAAAVETEEVEDDEAGEESSEDGESAESESDSDDDSSEDDEDDDF